MVCCHAFYFYLYFTCHNVLLCLLKADDYLLKIFFNKRKFLLHLSNIYHFQCSLFLCVHPNFCYMLSAQRTLSFLSVKVCFLLNFFSSYVPEKVLFSHVFLKGIVFFGWVTHSRLAVFKLSHVAVLSACVVSDEKLAVMVTFVSLYIACPSLPHSCYF